MNTISCMNISTKVFYKLVVSFLLVIVRHAQSTQNRKFVMSLQYLKNKGRNEVDVLHADKHEYLLQVNTIIYSGFGLAPPNYSGKFLIPLWP